MRWLLFVLSVLAAPQAAAIWPFASNDDENAGWVELDAVTPAYPKPADLVEFSVSGATSNRFLIDVSTISIGNDGVVRYVLVVRSAGGAENVSFEGIRCATREQKSYAFGQRNATWSPAREPQWRFIEMKDINRQHVVLFADFFCYEGKRPPRTVRDIAQRLRYGH